VVDWSGRVSAGCTAGPISCYILKRFWLYTVSQKKSENCFCHNFVKFSLTLIIFGMLMAKTTKLCKVHSFCTSPNLC